MRWNGPLLASGGFDLDLIPPEASLYEDFDLLPAEDGQEAQSSGTASLVPEGKDLDSAGCVLLAKTQPQSNISVPVGRTLCLITDEGRPALVTVKAVHKAANTVSVDVRVWQKPE